MRILGWRYRVERYYARFHTKYLADFVFVHINKTGGTSIEHALGLPFQHRTAVEVRDDIGVERWSRRFSFAFVRNPWDKVASHYRFRVQTNQTGLGDAPIAFEEWVLRAYGDRDPRYCDQPKMFMPQVGWICDEGGRQLVDFVGRFERLTEDFQHVCRRLGRDATLPHLKRSSRKDFRSVYTPRAVETVERCFAEDIARFGYAFE